jgi:predicted nucleic acid-binding protein
MTAFVDASVLVRHLTGDPPDQAARAARYLATADQLLLPDLILAEVACVLESYYEAPRDQVATALRAILAFPAIRVLDADVLQRTVEIYDVARLDFADAYLVASAERTGVGAIASFDRSVDRVPTVRRVEPG